MVGQLLEAIARRGLASGISLTATSYLAHQFETSALGTFLGMVALSQLLVMVFSAGLDISPTFMLRNHAAHMRQIWLISTIASLVLAAGCVLLGAAVVAVAPLLGSAGGKLQDWGICPFVAAAAIVTMVPQLACLQGLLKLRSYNFLQIVFPLTFLLLVLAKDRSVTALTPSSAILLWATAGIITAFAAALMLTPSVWVRYRVHDDNPPLPRRAFLGFSLQSYFANCIGTLNSRLPTVLAPLVLVPVAAGQFAGTILLSDVFSFFSMAIASVTFPLLAAATDTAERVDKLGRACRVNTTATLLAVATFLLFFEPLCGLLLGSSFQTTDFRLMASAVLLCAVAQSTSRLLCTDFAAQGKPLLSAVPNIPAAIMFALTFFLLHGWAEPWGAALAFCVSSLCFSMLTFVMYRRRFKIDASVIGLLTPIDLKLALAAVRRRLQQRLD